MKANGTTYQSNLAQAMQDLSVNKEHKAKRILDSPWVSLPNVREFSVEIQGWDPVFKTQGINKRLKPRIEFTPYINKGINRYIERQIRRLKAARESNNGRLYWTIAWHLLSKSNSFLVLAFKHVYPNWHRTCSLGFVLRQAKAIRKIAKSKDTNVNYSRVYIPKPGGSRPLGVPKPAWILWMHMWSNMLSYWLKPHLTDNQHGFRPGKGCLTAWKEIMENRLLDSKFIYESDLSNFFNEVAIYRVQGMLESTGVPEWVSTYITQINVKAPNYPMKARLKQFEEYFYAWCESAVDKALLDGKSPRGKPSWQWTSMDMMIEAFEDFSTNEDGSKWITLEDVAVMYGEAGYDLEPHKLIDKILYREPNAIIHKFKGLPQGLPTSPILSISILKDFLSQQKSVAYADDQVFFGDKEFTIKDRPDWGIIKKESKSGWVKFNGEWQKPLKFLGMEYDGKLNKLTAKTRNGATLEFSGGIDTILSSIALWQAGDHQASLNYLYGKDEILLHQSWDAKFKSKLIGYIQSRLYQDKWNLDDIEQDFELTYGSGSWMDYASKKWTLPHMDVFNSTSYASHSLLNFLRHSQGLHRPRRDGAVKLHIGLK